ncbi:MAG TPA: sugar phosphate isomerase/epimerase, partial [Bacteroidales bacterium]|nr:sugar phosphate isomerase/epimerase [Bacteroidales bacterium]
MKRRHFIKRSAAGAAGLSLMPGIISACSETANPLRQLGIITNTIAAPLKDDWAKTLREVGDIGYKYLEHGGIFGDDKQHFESVMAEAGLESLAGGASIAQMQGDDLKKLIDRALSLKKKYVVCYWPWMHSGEHIVMDDLKYAVDHFHLIGERCNDVGLRFATHNHDKEFRKVDDTVIYDYFLEYTDPALVTMELDIYWITKGGGDPLYYFDKYPGRFELLHMKDMNDDDDETFACVGSGKIDFQAILDKSRIAGVKHLIVEHDHPEHPMECA